ncbi:topoisomerase II, partial [Vibrio parahaemolyticus]|nr:topoisomerase II [Vibrio parahaemolyticus]
SLNVLADGRSGKKAKDEAYEWLNSDEVHPFSFVTCCVLSGYDPDEVRNLCQYTLRQLAKRNK